MIDNARIRTGFDLELQIGAGSFFCVSARSSDRLSRIVALEVRRPLEGANDWLASNPAMV